MSLLPKTLFGRNALLIVVLIVAGQLGAAVLVRQMVIRPRIDQIAETVARNVGAVRAGLLALPAADRPAFVEQFNRHALAGMAGATDRGERERVVLTALERSFVRSVSARVAQQGVEAVWRREAAGSLALRLTLDGTDHWVALPNVFPARVFTGAWLAAMGGSALLALAGALWLQRRLNDPLLRLVQAARTLAGGTAPAPLPEDGPSEIATVSRSFNQLVSSLAQAERERALMLAGISHDLRTPLTKLRLGVEILGDRTEPELVASMTRSVEEMDAIVGQFLDFARGDLAEPAVPTAIDTLARDVAAGYADHGKALVLELASPMPVDVRPQGMRRALTNLVENAFRHGRAPVVLATGADALSVWLEVRDHGDGISPGEVEALKQPFRRAEGARASPAGAGLGLAIVERIARAHGGRLDLRPGEQGAKGLCARITLPRTAGVRLPGA